MIECVPPAPGDSLVKQKFLQGIQPEDLNRAYEEAWAGGGGNHIALPQEEQDRIIKARRARLDKAV